MSLKKAAEQVRGAGRGKDTELVHFTRKEVGALQGLAKAAGGKLTRNPATGMLEAGFLDSMLPTILGIGANFILPGSGMIVGGLAGAAQNKENPLMGAALGAMGGYGGGQIAAGLQGAGAGAAQAAAQSAATDQLAQQAATESLAAQTVVDGAGMLPIPGADQSFLNQAAADATNSFTGSGVMDQLGQGAKAAFNDPSKFMEGMGGMKPTAKAAGLAAAPMIYDYMVPKQGGDSGIPEEGEGREFTFDPGYTGGTMMGSDPSSERQWYNSSYTPVLAEGGEVPGYFAGKLVAGPQAQQGMSREAPAGSTRGAMPLGAPESAQGKTSSGAPAWDVNSDGTFSKRVSTPAASASQGDGLFRGFSQKYGNSMKGRYMDMIANSAMRSRDSGRTGMGGQRYAEGGEVQMAEGGFVIPADVVSMAGNGSSSAGLEAFGSLMGAMPIDGPGDGMSDDIPASIDGRAPARVARQEAYLPPETVARMGGAQKLYSMVERVRKMAHGKTTQQRPVDLRKALA